MSHIFRRILPELTDANRAFWTAGQQGQLQITRCGACQQYIHPPLPICPACLGREVRPEAVAGTATVVSFTINHQPWLEGLPVPYVVAIVELDEQPGLRLTTNLIGQEPEQAFIGQRVKVHFEQHDDVWLPQFEPAS